MMQDVFTTEQQEAEAQGEHMDRAGTAGSTDSGAIVGEKGENSTTRAGGDTPQTEPPVIPEKRHRAKGEKLALPIPTRMAVTLDALQQGNEERIAAELVGMVHFEYVILRLPWIPGLRTRLVSGASATVRFVNNGELCGFQVPILTHIAKPSLLLFLEYPGVTEKLTLRQHKRFTCALPAQLHSRRGEADGVVADLSQGGCRIALDVRGQHGLRQTVVNDAVVLRLPLKPEGVPVAVSCSVRSVTIEVNKMQLGLSFTDADQVFLAALEDFLTRAYLLS